MVVTVKGNKPFFYLEEALTLCLDTPFIVEMTVDRIVSSFLETMSYLNIQGAQVNLNVYLNEGQSAKKSILHNAA